MKTLLCLTASAALVLTAQLRADDFSRALSPDDFAAAGLAKLTPGELARLDALVQAQRSGKISATVNRESSIPPAKPETSVRPPAEPSRVAQETPVAPKKPDVVVVAAGTKVSYKEVETQLVGSFRGYGVGTILTLANGQRWAVTNGSYWSGKNDSDKPRRVVIKPGTLGSYFLDIEDGGRPKVKLVGGSDSR